MNKQQLANKIWESAGQKTGDLFPGIKAKNMPQFIYIIQSKDQNACICSDPDSFLLRNTSTPHTISTIPVLTPWHGFSYPRS